MTRVLASLVFLVGCSWGMQQAPTIDPGTRPISCTQSRDAPVADVAGAVLVGLSATGAGFMMTAIGTNSDEARGYRNDIWVLGGIGVLVYALAAHSGFEYADRCERLNTSERSPKTE